MSISIASSSRPGSLIHDVTHNGRMAISFYGRKFCISFRGERDFIDRCFALCVNRGISGIGARLRFPFGVSAKFAYAVTRSKDHLLNGLAEQFRSEIIMNREVAPLSETWNEDCGYDVQFDEKTIGALAMSRAIGFMDNHIEHDDFMSKIPKSGPVYGLASPFAEKE
jgi:hypothetical protein